MPAKSEIQGKRLSKARIKKAVAVQTDIVNSKIGQVLEDYTFGKLMEENDPAKNFDLKETKKVYDQLEQG